jgi:hypothetical protein
MSVVAGPGFELTAQSGPPELGELCILDRLEHHALSLGLLTVGDCFYLETTAKLLKSLNGILAIFPNER